MKVGDLVVWLDLEGNPGKHVGIITIVHERGEHGRTSNHTHYTVFGLACGNIYYAFDDEIEVIG